MSKQEKKTIIFTLIGLAVAAIIGFLPPETELMTRVGWKYIGCFAFLLTVLISGALPDWASVAATMALVVALKVGKVSEVTAQFSGSTIWLCIGVFIMSIGINNSGIMKRIALWVLTKFPGTYTGQVSAMLMSGLVTTPMIPSAFAKTAIMAPLTSQVTEAVQIEPNTKPALGLWYANFICTYNLGNAFMSGSAFVGLMMGYMGVTYTWGEWFSATWLWYIISIVLTALFCIFYCRPKEKKEGNVEFIKEQYEALGPLSANEKKGFLIVACALALWLTQKLHGIDAGMVALLADVAFVACGLIATPDANAKGQWTLIVFIGGVLSIAGLMNTTGVATWIASWLAPIAAPFMGSPYIFVAFICILTYALRYVIVSQTCCLTVLVGVFFPLLPGAGISTFVMVFVAYMSTMLWNAEYMNPSVAGFVRMAGGKYVPFKLAAKASYFYMAFNLIAMLASVPVWQSLGLC